MRAEGSCLPAEAQRRRGPRYYRKGINPVIIGLSLFSLWTWYKISTTFCFPLSLAKIHAMEPVESQPKREWGAGHRRAGDPDL